MGDLAFSSFDEERFSAMFRTSVREMVEGALSKAPGRADTRQEVRSAAERLGNALVTHAATANEPGMPRGVHASIAAAGAPTADESSRRRRAFRVMAGVRQ
jgi:hypothetical protein